MKRLTIPSFVILCALALAAAAGCGGNQSTTATTATATGTGTSSTGVITSGVMRVTEAESGGTVTIDAGELLSVTLISNPSTGFHWVVSPNLDAAVLAQQGEPLYTPDPGEVMPGSGGKHTFTFRGTGAGSTELKMDYLSPANEPSNTTFGLKVNVR